MKHYLRELFAEKTRIILTILAIAWGTFSIATLLSIGEGLRLTFKQSAQSAGENMLTVTGGNTSRSFQGSHANQQINLTQQDFEAIAKLPNILAISKVYLFRALLNYKEISKNQTIEAVNANYANIHAIELESGGRFISPLDIREKRAVIVLGTRTRKRLFPNEDQPVGSMIQLNGYRMQVIGVMKEKPEFIATDQPDAFSNWIPESTYEVWKQPQKINAIAITYRDSRLLERLKKQIQWQMAGNHQTNPEDESIINFLDVAKRQDTINTFFVGMQIFLGVVGLLTLLIAGVGIANVMYASVRRATHDIGIRMALGARRGQILMHYLIEALLAAFIGGGIGLFMTVIAVIALRLIPMQGKLFQAIGQPKPVLSLLVMSLVILILGCIGGLAGFFPALRATKVDPAEALIYE